MESKINRASEILFNANNDGSWKNITDVNTVKELYKMVKNAESSIDNAYGVVRNDYKFNFSDMDHVLTQIANREIFTDTKKVGQSFDSKTENWNLMYEALLNSKIIDNFAGETRLVDDVTRIRFEGEKVAGSIAAAMEEGSDVFIETGKTRSVARQKLRGHLLAFMGFVASRVKKSDMFDYN